MRSLLVAILVGLTCVGAAAQDKIYKVRMPDGRILFTDRPPPGGVIVSEREAPPPAAPAAPPTAAQPGQAGTAKDQAAQADARLRERSERFESAFAAMRTAERELEAARLALEQGRAPADGEMIATARGRVRPGPAYQERVAELEKAVAAAEQKLARARDDLNALR